jgi:RecA-family ATPase
MEDETIHTQHDIATMCDDFTPEERADFSSNMLYCIDEEINDDPLDLSNEAHWDHVLKRLESFKPKVVFIDTAVAAFKIENENDNSEIGELMKKLRHLARQLNAAVIVAHHTGKQGENGLTQRVTITARGASVFEDQARSVYTFDVIKPKIKGLVALDKVVRLKGKKIKGAHIEDVYLDFDTTGQRRWFTEMTEIEEDGTDAIPLVTKQEEREDRFFNFLLASDGKVSRPAAMKHMGLAQRTFDDFVIDLLTRGAIIKEQTGERRPVTFSLPQS